jgi:hypothetical protein
MIHIDVRQLLRIHYSDMMKYISEGAMNSLNVGKDALLMLVYQNACYEIMRAVFRFGQFHLSA